MPARRNGGAGAPTLRAPDFVGLGAPRCGTTWIYRMLRHHPEVWIPWKEIHFFDSVDDETDSGFRTQSRAFRLAQSWRSLSLRLALGSIPWGQRLARQLLPHRAFHTPGYRWTFRYLLRKTTPEWYEDLFREGRSAGLCCGEITPAYFMLSASGIERFARQLPDVRAFLILRHPVHWAWSSTCLRARRAGKEPGSLSEEDLIALCPVPGNRSRADLGANLRRWLEHFPADRLLVEFHDSIRREPTAFLGRLCAHLGVSAFPARDGTAAETPINSAARGLPVPPQFERFAAARYLEEARVLAALAGGPAEVWLSEIETVLSG